MNYKHFLSELDKKLEQYRLYHKDYIHCKCGCSSCCENGDYPISQLELEYLMQGFATLDNNLKIKIQNNFKTIVKGGVCPFLENKKCLVYEYRPIICRVHGLAYLYAENIVKVPYCANNGKNYAEVYKDNTILINPIKENLDTIYLLKDFKFGAIRNLADWINQENL